MTDVIALSELSDEPVIYAALTGLTSGTLGKPDRSPRLEAVLERLPAEGVRIRNGLDNMDIKSVATLLATDDDRFMRAKNLGPKSRGYIDAALAVFGLQRVGTDPPLVVRDGASAAEAHAQRLSKWIESRIAECVTEQDRCGLAGAAHQTTEQEVLTDVMLILDGREPLNARRWFGCRGDIDCDREYGHDGNHRRTTEVDGVEETEAWP